MMTTRRILMTTTALSLGVGLFLLTSATLDEAIRTAIIITMGISGVVLIGSALLEIRQVTREWDLPEPEEPPTSRDVIRPRDPVNDAIQAIENAEQYKSDTETRVRIKIDIQDDDEGDA